MQSASRLVILMEWLEEVARILLRPVINGAFFLGLAFIFYIVGGFLGIRLGVVHLPYSFLSLQTDPVFNLLAASIGILVCVGASALLFLTYLNDYINPGNDIVILCSCIGFGFGAGVLRITAPFLIDLLL